MWVHVCDSTVSQEVVHAPLFHPTGACQVLACVRISVGVWESEREVYLCLLKGVRVSTASHWAPLYSRFMWATACQAVCVCVCVHSGVHVYDWGRERSCQVRLCQWPHKATEGHGSSALAAMSAVKSGVDGPPANHRVRLGAGEYRKWITNIEVG